MIEGTCGRSYTKEDLTERQKDYINGMENALNNLKIYAIGKEAALKTSDKIYGKMLAEIQKDALDHAIDRMQIDINEQIIVFAEKNMEVE